jgi:hypothetical protein
MHCVGVPNIRETSTHTRSSQCVAHGIELINCSNVLRYTSVCTYIYVRTSFPVNIPLLSIHWDTRATCPGTVHVLTHSHPTTNGHESEWMVACHCGNPLFTHCLWSVSIFCQTSWYISDVCRHSVESQTHPPWKLDGFPSPIWCLHA